jgi:putative membrane protein
VLLSRVVSWLLTNQPVLVNAFFFGLIMMTVYIVGKTMKRWTPAIGAVLAVSTVGTFFLVQMVPVQTPEALWFVFLSGALAICAMILPGISGAFILLLLGKYQFIMDAVHHRDLAVVLVFMAGMGVGILCFVRVLGWLFAKYHDLTIAILTGFVAGSLNKIWPWKETLETILSSHGKLIPIREANVLPPAMDGQFAAAIALFVFGCVVAYALHAIPQKHLKQQASSS